MLKDWFLQTAVDSPPTQVVHIWCRHPQLAKLQCFSSCVPPPSQSKCVQQETNSLFRISLHKFWCSSIEGHILGSLAATFDTDQKSKAFRIPPSTAPLKDPFMKRNEFNLEVHLPSTLTLSTSKNSALKLPLSLSLFFMHSSKESECHSSWLYKATMNVCFNSPCQCGNELSEALSSSKWPRLNDVMCSLSNSLGQPAT